MFQLSKSHLAFGLFLVQSFFFFSLDLAYCKVKDGETVSEDKKKSLKCSVEKNKDENSNWKSVTRFLSCLGVVLNSTFNTPFSYPEKSGQFLASSFQILLCCE